VGLPGQQRPSERLRATPRRLADKPAPSLHSVRLQKKPRQVAGLSGSQSCLPTGLAVSGRSLSKPTTSTPGRIGALVVVFAIQRASIIAVTLSREAL
jgi:hypothetical protein